MKVLHCGSLDVKTGGPALSTSLSMKGVLPYGYKAEVWQQPLLPGGKLFTEEFPIHFRDKVKIEEIQNVDIYHIQGLWEMPNHKMAAYARVKGIPYVITLRGMFYEPDQKVFKKRVALALYQRKDLSCAACIQATCMEELKEFRKSGIKTPVAVLPNPIDAEGLIEQPIPEKSKFQFGYIGRIDSRKRVERLIYAFDANRETFKDAELIIMGAWDAKYEQFLKDEVKRLKLNNVIFTGFVSGSEKNRWLSGLSALVVPSDFENFGNIVTEALVRGVPVIASKGTPWQDLESYNCGYWIDNDQSSINKAMARFFSTSSEERYEMSLNGRRLIQDKYTIDQNGRQLAQLYDWILKKTEKPDFVYTV